VTGTVTPLPIKRCWVSCCADCPFYGVRSALIGRESSDGYRGDGYRDGFCKLFHAYKPVDYTTTVPFWCPLIESSIVVDRVAVSLSLEPPWRTDGWIEIGYLFRTSTYLQERGLLRLSKRGALTATI